MIAVAYHLSDDFLLRFDFVESDVFQRKMTFEPMRVKKSP